MDIGSRNSLSSCDAHCAFPSWPRRESLSESDRVERPTSYLSDDDLFLSDPFDDDARSVSSASSSGSPAAMSPPQPISDFELMEMQRERLALQKEYLRQMVLEKEQRRRAAQRQQKKRSSSGSSKKSPKSKLSAMTPIME